MGTLDLDELVARFDSEAYDPEQRVVNHTPIFAALLKEIVQHADNRFWHYIPCHTGPEFLYRLEGWLANAELTFEDLKALLQLIPQIQFVDRDDMLSLYRAAFTGPISRWLMDQGELTFAMESENLREALEKAARETWFCPVTDSMDIAQFHHVNLITGQMHRPPWKTLHRLGDMIRIREYMRAEKYSQLVLLEDFVGTGTQTRGPLLFAAKNLCPDIPVLFVPLIISGANIDSFRETFEGLDGFSFAPVSIVPKHVHLTPIAEGEEPLIFTLLREVVAKTFERVRQPGDGEMIPLEEPFGFGSLGMLLILYTNCPNNTVPLIHHSNVTWNALFPRVSRR